MNTSDNQPTRLTADARNQQSAANTNHEDDFLGNYDSFEMPEYTCHRQEQVLKGEQIWFSSELTQKMGITCPVFLTRSLNIDFLRVCSSQQEWDALLDTVLAKLAAALAESPPHRKWIFFPFAAPYSAEGRKLKDPVRLMASRGPFDVNEPRQAITLWYPYPDYDPFIYLEDKE